MSSASPPSFPSNSVWYVHKFGGTSLATSECYANSAEIIRSIPLVDSAAPTTSTASNASSSSSTISVTPTQIRKCIVVSAMGEVKTHAGSLVASLIKSRSPHKSSSLQQLDKVTNYLIKCTQLAAKNDVTYLKLLQELKERHINVVKELLAPAAASSSSAADSPPSPLLTSVLSSLDSDFTDLSYILRAVWLSRQYDPDHNWWFGYGEIWSARLMNAYLNELEQRARKDGGGGADNEAQQQRAVYVDAREIIQLSTHKDPIPNYEISTEKLNAYLASHPEAASARILVVTGYIASTASGIPTTLGRDGSDYSASIFAALLRARSVTIWTDVDGVYSANPAQVKNAVILPELSYDEASELAYFGAKVLHPKTMTPVVKHSIPVWIRNTFNSSHPGTCIISGERIETNGKIKKSKSMEEIKNAVNASASKSISASPLPQASVVGYGVRGFSSISPLSLLIVEGTGMIGVSGICARLFGALREAAVSVVLITQGGSEHSICLCVPSSVGSVGLEVIRKEFRDELELGEISTVDLRTGVACLAIVGDGMRSRRGVAARMFAALADSGCNIIAIAQGSSERNISVIVNQDQVEVGLKAVHEAFLADEEDKEYQPLLLQTIPSATTAK